MKHTSLVHTVVFVLTLVSMLTMVIMYGVWEEKLYVISQNQQTIAQLSRQLIEEVAKATPTPAKEGKVLSWASFKDPQTGLALEYPLNWQNKKDMPPDDNAIFELYYWGEHQVAGPEIFDGAYITVYKPLETEEDAVKVAKGTEGERDNFGENKKFTEIVLNKNAFVKVTTSDERYVNYYLKKGNKVYFIKTFASEDKYLNVINRMLQTITF